MSHPTENDPPAPPRRTHWAASLGFFAGSLLVYALLRQRTLHGYDVFQLMRWLEQPAVVHPRHPGYLPLVRLLHQVLAPLGASPLMTLQWASCLGGSAAVLLAHRAALQLRPASVAARVAAICGSCMGWAFFATVAEMHAVFLPLAMAAFWAAAVYVRRGGLWPIVLVGVASGAGSVVHFTGHLLVFVLPLFALVQLPAPRRRHALRLGVAVAVHFAVWGALFVLLRHHGELVASPDPVGYVAQRFDLAGIAANLPRVVLREWLLPFLPGSVLLLALLGSRRWRLAAALLLTLVAGYLLCSTWLLLDGAVEHGAYLLPLALPLALLLGRALQRRGQIALLVATLGWSLGYVFVFGWHSDRLPRDDAFGRAVLQLQQQQPTRVLLGDFREYDSVLALQPFADVRNAGIEIAVARHLGEPDAAQIRAWLQWQVLQAKAVGERFAVSDAALERLRRELAHFEQVWQDAAALPRQRLEQPPFGGQLLLPP